MRKWKRTKSSPNVHDHAGGECDSDSNSHAVAASRASDCSSVLEGVNMDSQADWIRLYESCVNLRNKQPAAGERSAFLEIVMVGAARMVESFGPLDNSTESQRWLQGFDHVMSPIKLP